MMKKNLNDEEAVKLLKSIGAFDKHRPIMGEERKRLELMFAMMEPIEESNNQHSWTSTYKIGDRVYHCHFFPGADEPMIEEFIKYTE